jgi:predicted AlkP superfamily pyrophosphatase or phosphodiesterase
MTAPRRNFIALLFALGALAGAATAGLGGRARAAEVPPPPPVILISADGFRWDYCEQHPQESAALRALKREGVSARGLVPVFPSNTFPNHYSIVTGLYPSNHGIVNNDFLDAASGLVFHYNQPNAVRDARWWRGEPIWATAVKQGKKSAASFWVGSEAPIAGVRPTFWKPYDYSIPFAARLDELIRWLQLPPAERPAIVAFYLTETNAAGHRFGPDSPELAAAVATVDRCIGTLVARLHAEKIAANLIVVSDHGMTATARTRGLILEDFLPAGSYQVDSDGSVATLRPTPESDVSALLAAAKKIPHAKAYRVEELPARLHVQPTPRTAPVWVLPEEGWQVVARATFERFTKSYAPADYIQGDHGYDPALPAMHGIFIASGPAFRRGVEIPAVENIHVYNLLCALAGLQPAPNDGDDRLVKSALR